MIQRLQVPLERLARYLDRPTKSGSRRLRHVGWFHALYPDPRTTGEPGRWQTLVLYQNRFLLLVDEFHADEVRPFTLTLPATRPLRGGRRRYVTHEDRGPLALHPLGDYTTEHQRGRLTFRQRLAQGRFLLALTRDPNATVRVLNGWAVEIRSEGRVYHLLHSNRSRRLRPLGPIQTDALFALADWSQDWYVSQVPVFGANLHILQTSQLLWDEHRKLTADLPVDLLFQAEPERQS